MKLKRRSVLVGGIEHLEVFVEESLELKKDYVLEHSAEILVMGDDWKGKFDYLQDHCKVVYLPRTPSISTTAIIEIVSDR